MAPANDGTGEILSSQRTPATLFPWSRGSLVATPTGKSTTSWTTPPRDPEVAVVQAEDDDDDEDRASSSSSPPTHPAFFSPDRGATKKRRGGGEAPSSSSPPGKKKKENVCPVLTGRSPMAASFSPLGSPLAVLMSSSPPRRSGAAAAVAAGARAGMPGKVVVVAAVATDDGLLTPPGGRAEACDDDGGGGGGNGTRRILKDVDLNIVTAALPSEKANGGSVAEADGTPKDSSSKKNKRKNKKTNGVAAAHGDEKDQTPPEPTSYAEAVKEDPADVEKREAQSYSEKENRHVPTNGGEETKPTPAGDRTFAEALKEPAGKDAGGVRSSESQASTVVDYPELHSGSEDEDENERREKDRHNAPELLYMRWAPLRVPFKRRLQTLAVLFHCLCIGISLSIFFFSCAIIPLWPIIIIYLIYLLFATDHVDGKLRSRREWVRRLPIWTHFAEYFPARLHKTHDLIPTRKYIFGYHPHGIISHGAWAAFATDALGFSEKFPGITNSLLTLDSNFRLPLYREYVLSMGVQSVSKESITNILTRGGANKEGMGRAVTVVVGGARESLEAQPNSMRLIINERKGFIKVALQTGADLVPVLGFGENDLYDQLDPHKHPWLHNMQRYFLKVWKFTVPLLHGRGIFNYDVGLMPYRRPMNIVVGKPIPVFQASAPDNAEVNRLHALYTAELQKIWDRYKDEFAPHRKEEMQFMS